MTDSPDYVKQQALDALRKAISWCIQVGVSVSVDNGQKLVDGHYETAVRLYVFPSQYDFSNLTLKYISQK